ncbi:MAG: DUF3347 domain-containing protein [Bacteroidetes bacterium]|nr:DUF3347 domain-containing protein [Bacteroidota bacterium]MBS1935106.1 DUF3347 domain-containing protein [Bacteroidota bacterium]
MKRIFFLCTFLGGIFIQLASAQDTTQNQLSVILNDYYEVRNALVSSDAAGASAKAGELLTAISTVNPDLLPRAGQKAFAGLKDKLAFDARHISESKDITHQREHFAGLSVNMIALAQKAKLSASPIYQAFCPMKKSYWLTSESSIKNPYYGNAMLGCGQIIKTLQ